jgi:hypothetical protein
MSTKRDWQLLFSGFTRRNAGRPTRLELNDPDLGAQVVEEDYPLRGVAYDPRDERIEIMLGEAGATDRHLTHTISHVDSVECLRSDDADHALCIEHQGTRTLLYIRHSSSDLGACGGAEGLASHVG